MIITFVSNYINHHQIPFCDAMYRAPGSEFHFIQTQPMAQERVQMGWSADLKKTPYVSLLYEDEAGCRELIRSSDIVLLGWSGREDGYYMVDRNTTNLDFETSNNGHYNQDLKLYPNVRKK